MLDDEVTNHSGFIRSRGNIPIVSQENQNQRDEESGSQDNFSAARHRLLLRSVTSHRHCLAAWVLLLSCLIRQRKSYYGSLRKAVLTRVDVDGNASIEAAIDLLFDIS